jgi:hypothetical protein
MKIRLPQQQPILPMHLNFGLQMNQVDTLAKNGTAGWNGAYAFAYETGQ